MQAWMPQEGEGIRDGQPPMIPPIPNVALDEKEQFLRKLRTRSYDTRSPKRRRSEVYDECRFPLVATNSANVNSGMEKEYFDATADEFKQLCSIYNIYTDVNSRLIEYPGAPDFPIKRSLPTKEVDDSDSSDAISLLSATSTFSFLSTEETAPMDFCPYRENFCPPLNEKAKEYSNTIIPRRLKSFEVDLLSASVSIADMSTSISVKDLTTFTSMELNDKGVEEVYFTEENNSILATVKINGDDKTFLLPTDQYKDETISVLNGNIGAQISDDSTGCMFNIKEAISHPLPDELSVIRSENYISQKQQGAYLETIFNENLEIVGNNYNREHHYLPMPEDFHDAVRIVADDDSEELAMKLDTSSILSMALELLRTLDVEQLLTFLYLTLFPQFFPVRKKIRQANLLM